MRRQTLIIHNARNVEFDDIAKKLDGILGERRARLITSIKVFVLLHYINFPTGALSRIRIPSWIPSSFSHNEGVADFTMRGGRTYADFPTIPSELGRPLEGNAFWQRRVATVILGTGGRAECRGFRAKHTLIRRDLTVEGGSGSTRDPGFVR